MIYITSDTTADLGELFNKRGVKTIPLTVILGNEMCFDGVDVNPEKIYSFVDQTGKLPKTSARSIEEYKEFFNSVKQNPDDAIIHFSLSGGISITCHNAFEAAAEMENVYVVDSKSLSSGSGLLVLYACDLRDENCYTAKEIYEKCIARVDAVQASFIVDTMEYLHKGGRCSGLVAFAAGALKIKPSLQLKEGKIVVGKKYMFKPTKAIAPLYVKNVFEMFNTPDTKRIFITYTYNTSPEVIQAVKNAVVNSPYEFEEVIETMASSTITCHCGAGTIGILYINDGKGIEQQ